VKYHILKIATYRMVLIPLILSSLFPFAFAGPLRAPELSGGEMVRSVSVKIAGSILALPANGDWNGEWTIGRTKVNVTASTKIEGQPVISAYAEAEVDRQPNGQLSATRIEIKSIPVTSNLTSFADRIEELPATPGRIGTWKIGNRTVVVNDLTKIEQRQGTVAVGAMAGVRATGGSGPVLTAIEIVILPTPVGGPASTRLVGHIEKLSDPIQPGEWVVSGRGVTVSQQTVIDQQNGTIMVGSGVELTGTLGSGGKFSATRILVQPPIQLPPMAISLRGKVESLPTTSDLLGDWKVAGRTIQVTSQTRITGRSSQLTIGTLVEVRGTTGQNGQILASAVLVIGTEAAPGKVTFVGEIRSIETTATSGDEPSLIGIWKVGERTVQVDATTRIDQKDGLAQVGAIAEVEGTLELDGTVLAREIEIRKGTGTTVSYTRFFGTVETLPNGGILTGTWVVDGREVTVGARTRILRERGTPEVGAFVQVEGSQRTDGTVDAVTIQVERDKDAPDGTIGFIHFYGSVLGLPTEGEEQLIGEWTIGPNNRRVDVDSRTKIETQRGEIQIGAFVEVKGYLLVDGGVQALSIAVRPAPLAGSPIGSLSYVEFIARVSELPDAANFIGQWTFDDGRVVNVGRSTMIDRQRGRIEVGALAEVVGAELPNGEIDARLIEVEFGSTSTAAGFVQYPPITSVSAANYTPGGSSSSIIASFGSGLATSTELANSLPLPTELGGVTVMVDGRPAGLFFVSPGQINYQIPDELLPGTAMVSVLRQGQPVAQGMIEINGVAPSIFTADSSGTGTPAGQALRVQSNGEVRYEPLSRLDGGAGRILPVTIERRPGDQLYLVLYGTGLRGLEDQDGNAANGLAELVEVSSGTTRLDVLYAGNAPGYAGLDQFNLVLPASLVGEVTLTIRVRDGEGNVRRANEVAIIVR
jgi:uncharacterized protein (TIGR03437 family)